MKKNVVLFWLERHARELEATKVDHVALAQSGVSYGARRVANEAAARQAEEHAVELRALRSAAKFLKEQGPEEIPDEVSE